MLEDLKPPYPPTPLADIEAGWKALQGCDWNTVSVDWIKQQLKGLAKGLFIGTSTVRAGTLLHRGTNFNPAFMPSHVARLGAPPPELIKEPQRCSREGESVFYCCDQPLTIFRELRKAPGDRIILSKWEVLRDFIVAPLGFHPEIFDRLGAGRECPDPGSRIAFPFPDYKPENDMLYKIFAECLAIHVPDNEKYRYKLSIAITEMLTEKSKSSLVPGKVNRGADGLLYPTMRMSANRNNLAIKFDISKSHLKFVEATEVALVSDDENTLDIKWSRHRHAHGSDATGALRWLHPGRPPVFFSSTTSSYSTRQPKSHPID